MRVTDEQIKKAKTVDLLAYLQSEEPNNLRHLGNGTYCTRDHDSLKLSNGKWYWFSHHFGGYTALDYLIKVRGLPFMDAVVALSRSDYRQNQTVYERKHKIMFNIPPLNADISVVKNYLKGRGIDGEIVDWCHEKGYIEEGAVYHGCIFLGYDGNSARFGAIRATYGTMKKDLLGSDKRFSFRIVGEGQDTLHLFEAAIDLLSYATLEKRAGRDWQKDALLSLSGVYASGRQNDVPPPVAEYLSKNPQTKTVCVHFDNDEVGRRAAEHIAEALGDKYTVLDCPAPLGKDYNDFLQNKIRKEKQRKEQER